MATEQQLIDPNEFLNRLENTVYDTPTDFGYTPGLIKTVLKQTKTVDAVEVVRCKDCKHWVECESSLIGAVMCCTGQGSAYIQKAADDFCSYGERKANGP